jgi:hypothetical protein
MPEFAPENKGVKSAISGGATRPSEKWWSEKIKENKGLVRVRLKLFWGK